MASSQLMAQGIDRRRALLSFVKAYKKKHDMAPSIAEIAAGIGVSSKTAVRHHLETLRREGYVDWVDGKYRSLRITTDKRY